MPSFECSPKNAYKNLQRLTDDYLFSKRVYIHTINSGHLINLRNCEIYASPEEIPNDAKDYCDSLEKVRLAEINYKHRELMDAVDSYCDIHKTNNAFDVIVDLMADHNTRHNKSN